MLGVAVSAIVGELTGTTARGMKGDPISAATINVVASMDTCRSPYSVAPLRACEQGSSDARGGNCVIVVIRRSRKRSKLVSNAAIT